MHRKLIDTNEVETGNTHSSLFFIFTHAFFLILSRILSPSMQFQIECRDSLILSMRSWQKVGAINFLQLTNLSK